jgi:hypothetical protein
LRRSPAVITARDLGGLPVKGLVDLGGSVPKDGTLWVANGIDRLIGVPASELAAP